MRLKLHKMDNQGRGFTQRKKKTTKYLSQNHKILAWINN